jgi:dethiobiotin synthetase
MPGRRRRDSDRRTAAPLRIFRCRRCVGANSGAEMDGIFVTGTDTEVGKTYVGVAVLREMRDRGIRTAAMKPVASGARLGPAGMRNDDAERLLAATGSAADYQLVNPYCFGPPIAPHLAAAEAGERIALGRILDCAARLRAGSEFLLVEGVGGWRVPLDESIDVSVLAGALDLPVLLVVGLRLGCINHALLTAAAIRADGRPLAGWVANCVDPGYSRIGATIDTISNRLGIAPLGSFAHASAAATVGGESAGEVVQALLCSKC